jgi:putative phosphoribosyl transferase
MYEIDLFDDRPSAGRRLAKLLADYQQDPEAIIVALPRGGVITAGAIAKVLKLPLDLVITRKIGAEENPEFAIAAVSEHHLIFHPQFSNFTEWSLSVQIEQERREIKRRQEKYQVNDRKNWQDKKLILVDDGIATGLTIKAAILELREYNPKKIIVATPVVSPDVAEELKTMVDEIYFISAPVHFMSVGQFYRYFPQVTDEEVVKIMQKT